MGKRQASKTLRACQGPLAASPAAVQRPLGTNYMPVSTLFGCQTWVIQGTTETYCRPLSRLWKAKVSRSLVGSAAVLASAGQALMFPLWTYQMSLVATEGLLLRQDRCLLLRQDSCLLLGKDRFLLAAQGSALSCYLTCIFFNRKYP